MAAVLSWFRRVRRTTRVCLASAALLIFWGLVEGVAGVMTPLIAAPLLGLLGVAFVWWHWIRPRRFKRRRGPADVRLRRLSPGSLRPLAVGIIVACVVFEAVYFLQLRFFPVPEVDPFWELAVLAQQPWGWLPVSLMIVVLAPLIEETVFRGWIQRPLERLWGPVPAVVLTATLFSLVHFIPEYLPYYFVVGLALGGIVVLTRSLWSSLLLHASFNFQATALGFAGLADFYEEVELAQQTPVVLVSTAVVLAGGIVLVAIVRRLRAIVRPARPVRVTMVPSDAASVALLP